MFSTSVNFFPILTNEVSNSKLESCLTNNTNFIKLSSPIIINSISNLYTFVCFFLGGRGGGHSVLIYSMCIMCASSFSTFK